MPRWIALPQSTSEAPTARPILALPTLGKQASRHAAQPCGEAGAVQYPAAAAQSQKPSPRSKAMLRAAETWWTKRPPLRCQPSRAGDAVIDRPMAGAGPARASRGHPGDGGPCAPSTRQRAALFTGAQDPSGRPVGIGRADPERQKTTARPRPSVHELAAVSKKAGARGQRRPHGLHRQRLRPLRRTPPARRGRSRRARRRGTRNSASRREATLAPGAAPAAGSCARSKRARS